MTEPIVDNINEDLEIGISKSYIDINPHGTDEINIANAVKQEIHQTGATELPLELVGGFSKEELLKMASIAKLSYVKEYWEDSMKQYSYKKEKLLEDGYKLIELETSKLGLRVIILIKGNEVIVGFRGTKNKQNILSDLNCILTTSGFMEGRVHKGFYRAFQEVWPLVRKVIDDEFINKDPNEIEYKFTGHSMGGAVAKIAAQYVHNEWNVPPSKIKVATFGDPRVFDTRQANIYNQTLGENTIRVVQHHRDPIPAIAPGSLGYKHVGAQIRVKPTAGITAHKMDGYFEGINNMNEFIEVKSVSFFYYPSLLMQYLNEKIIGTFQHYIKDKHASSGHKFWHEKEIEARNDYKRSLYNLPLNEVNVEQAKTKDLPMVLNDSQKGDHLASQPRADSQHSR